MHRLVLCETRRSRVQVRARVGTILRFHMLDLQQRRSTAKQVRRRRLAPFPCVPRPPPFLTRTPRIPDPVQMLHAFLRESHICKIPTLLRHNAARAMELPQAVSHAILRTSRIQHIATHAAAQATDMLHALAHAMPRGSRIR